MVTSMTRTRPTRLVSCVRTERRKLTHHPSRCRASRRLMSAPKAPPNSTFSSGSSRPKGLAEHALATGTWPCRRRTGTGRQCGQLFARPSMLATCRRSGPTTPSGWVGIGTTQVRSGSGTTGPRSSPTRTGRRASQVRRGSSGRSPGSAWSLTGACTTRSPPLGLVRSVGFLVERAGQCSEACWTRQHRRWQTCWPLRPKGLPLSSGPESALARLERLPSPRHQLGALGCSL
mmetsp:Transcript_28006/g.65389  ORF Transcript_28006/g.65389 Transcript_28006/m.65389 type:complete len:232 (-) Transcript_28006:173-868(-)